MEITNATTFTVTLSAVDKININGLLNKNGLTSDTGTTYNLAAADNWLAGAAASTDIADLTGNGITVSNVSFSTLTSATYDFNTGVLAVTSSRLAKELGATNDIDPTKLTLTGSGNVTHTLTSPAVEVTDETSFSITLSAADKLVVNGLLDKDGTSADDATTYNLAAADDYMPGAGGQRRFG